MKVQYVYASSHSLGYVELQSVLASGWYKLLSDTYNSVETVISYHQKQSQLFDALTYIVSVDKSLIALNSLISTAEFADNLYRLQDEFLVDVSLQTDDISYVLQRLSRILDTYNLQDVSNTQAEFISQLAVIMAMTDIINVITLEELSDNALLSESLSNKIIAYQQLLDTLLFSFTVGENSLTLVLSDTFITGDTVNTQAIFKSIISDEMLFFTTLGFDGAEYVAYALNTQSNGISEFTNFGFNSFAYPYAATSEGIYTLDSASDDAGTNIDASIRTGIVDFGTSLKKQVPYAYLGITERGRVLLKTISADRGVKKERWYEVQSYNDATDTTRVQMGKGVKAKYWQFEISNIEGEDFELESMEVIPLVLKRRKQ